ncbi:hypothetical protein [Amycolatopsis sp. cg13]|uniref:hypothetical protein n=1 Tax=Amycolatopsis sp. cg13 TaxID=3238807 RepID=UPI003523EA3A
MPIADLTPDARVELAWLENIYPSAGYTGPGHVVRQLLPSGYPVYLRILHAFAHSDDDTNLRSWASLAARIGLEIHPETCHRTLARADVATGPRQWLTQSGRLFPREQRALSSILAEASGTSDVFFGYDVSADAAGGIPHLVIAAPLDGLDELRKRVDDEVGIESGPDYWMPRGHAWVVCSDHDLASTYVACDEDVARAIFAHPDLEALSVTLETRIDFGADPS